VGVKVSKITTLERDLALALSAHSIRIEAPIPGKAVIGIEIPNSAISVVGMRDVVGARSSTPPRPSSSCRSARMFGHADHHRLERMPHLLVAGSTAPARASQSIVTFARYY